MSELMDSSIEVAPLGAQVMLFSSEAKSFPEWETGEEPAVANDDAVMIATRGDADGDVTIHVTTDDADGPFEVQIFGCDIDILSGVVEFGNVLSAELGKAEIGRGGRYSVSVSVDVPELPSEVWIHLSPAVA